MTRNELNDAYFDWMYRLVCDNEQYSTRTSYKRLLGYLYSVDFEYTHPMDDNRAADGVDLRYHFGEDHGYSHPMIASYLDDRPCSMLEMMVALSIRLEEHIMTDPDIGDRTGQWFWNMIVNMHLGSMTDNRFEEDYVEDIVARFLDRDYERNGDGGLFRVDNPNVDMRNLDIWYQMCWYLKEIV